MTVNGINGANTSGAGTSVQAGQLGMSQAGDPFSKNIQSQIANVQKQLQELSSNKEMSIEEKSKKRQELQQQINDLNMQLRQHQIEQRREKQRKKESFDDMLGGSQKVGANKDGSQNIGLSTAGMEAMISADAAMGQARVQGSVATKMEGRAGVLETEIQLDSGRGWDVTAKQEELAEVEQKAMDATTSQMASLSRANQEIEEAAESDKTAKKSVAEEKEAGAEEQVQDAANADAAVPNIGTADTVASNVESSNTEASNAGLSTIQYKQIDIRL